MKHNKICFASTWIISFTLIFTANAQYVKREDIQDKSFRDFLVTWEECASLFINGDPSLWKANSSQSKDATILGAFGGYGEKGWEAVGPRYDWASSQYKKSGAKVQVQYLSVVVSDDLAYTVGIEKSDAMLGDMKKTSPRILRSTQVFRKENGQWKLLHRHADPLVEKKGADAQK